MNTDQLETILGGAEETANLEVKAAMSWDVTTLVKDILAISNVLDGGYIIIGIEDNTFVRQGLSQEQIESFDIDVMKDQVAHFADPHCVFRRHVVQDRQGLSYIAIEISTFAEIPVICARDGADVQAGTIYFRSRARRPASARVSNNSDMREIIEASVARRLQGLKRVGLLPDDTVDAFDEELGGL